MTETTQHAKALGNDPEAYRAELERRWSGLLSYRYIGRNHSSMNLGPEDNTVRIRHDMRNEAGGIMVAPLAIASPEGCQTDMVAVPNPVIGPYRSSTRDSTSRRSRCSGPVWSTRAGPWGTAAV